VLTWLGRNRFGSILAKFVEFLHFLAILVKKWTIWSILLCFWNQKKISYKLVRSFFDGFTNLGQFWPNLGHFYSFLQFWSKNGPFCHYFFVFLKSAKNFLRLRAFSFWWNLRQKKSIFPVAPPTTAEHAKQSASRGIPFSIISLTHYTLVTPRQSILVSIPYWVDHLAVLCSVNWQQGEGTIQY